MSKKSDEAEAGEAAEDRRESRADEKRERAAEDREAAKAEKVKVAEAAKAKAAEVPFAEYPKMLYIGARRQQVTVNTPEEEKHWLDAEDEAETSAKKRGER